MQAVIAANPHTIVVEMSAGPLTVPWIKDHAAAMLQAWWVGEEGGNAIADVLFGDTNPGGHLPYTVYASPQQVPPQDEYDVTKGFTYLYLKGDPLLPFGHGLSYTTFEYSDLKLSSGKIDRTGKLTVSLSDKTTGPRAGDEVVQLYVHEQKSRLQRPAKELRGFQRINLQPGASAAVTLDLPAEKLAFYDVTRRGFAVDPGKFDVMVGSSSEHIRLRGEVEVTPG